MMRPLELKRKPPQTGSVGSWLIDNFWRRTAPLWPGGKRPGPSGRDEVRRLVTLASIVERETAVPSERPRVAGVYANRLRLNMLLQADPTTAYGLGEGFDGKILRRKHLDDEGNPYNTYKHPGLPPGPICSPGLACLKAAANPEQQDYIYFCRARGRRLPCVQHQFSRSQQGRPRILGKKEREVDSWRWLGELSRERSPSHLQTSPPLSKILTLSNLP